MASGLRLYSSQTSPFVRKVLVLIHEAEKVGEVEVIPASGTPLAPGTNPIARNPLGKIPTLERADGPALYDSRVICRYLDDLWQAGLYPAKPALWDVLTIEATGDGISEAGVLMVYESRLRDEGHRSEDWVEGQWVKITRALDAVEGRWMAHLARRVDAGQIALACALGYLDLRHDARGWRAGRPALADWFARFAERPSMQATKPS